MDKKMQEKCDSAVEKIKEAAEELYGYFHQGSDNYGELEEKINSASRYLTWPYSQEGDYLQTKMKSILENEEKGLPLKK